MLLTIKRALVGTTTLFLAAVLFIGCTGGDDGGSGGGGGGGGGTGGSGSGNKDADAAFWAKVEQHWLKTPNGWTTEYAEQIPLNPSVRVLRQFRELKLSFNVKQLTESDRLNNIEWMGWTEFGMTPSRWWRAEDNYEYPQGWSRWRDEPPTYEVAVFKRNGQWFVEDTTSLGRMFEGTKPADVPEG